MKKIASLSILFASLGMIFSLASCSTGGSNSDYKKVKKAFDGVESSLKAKKSKSNKQALLYKLAINEAPSDSFETLFNSYAESRGDTIDELEYDQPPMIQFQCLKTVFESIGESFDFSNKYYDTISGDFYFDLNTGDGKTAQDGETYHYTYDFVLGLGVMLGDDGLITADISFDIGLDQGNNHYDVSWFVKMYLEYDFNNNTPTYTLLMLSDSDETDFPYRIGVTYEYDYVKVNQNKISEWRKFYYEVDQKLVRDSSHPDFDSYKDDVAYKTGNLSWYKNSDLGKVKNLDADNDLAFAKELFDLGLNTTDIAKENYFKGNGIQTSKISDMYRSFSNVFGKDIIYALITEETNGSGEEKNAASLRFVFSSTGGGFDNVACTNEDHDITFRDLFSEGTNAWDGDYYPVINYMDEHGAVLGSESDLSKFRISVSYNNETFEPSLDDRVDIIFKGEAVQPQDYPFTLTLMLRNNEQVRGTLNLVFRNADNSSSGNADDDVIASIGVEGDDGIIGSGFFSLIDDMTIEAIFEPNTTHREYMENTAEFRTMNNYNFIYRNSKGQKIGNVPLSDINFGIKDSDDDQAEYMYDPSFATTNVSELWYAVNSYVWTDGISVCAMCKNKDLDENSNNFKFFITAKRDIVGVPLADAIKDSWPTKPIKAAGFRDDLPYINPSQNISEDDNKYSFYFDYGTGSSWGSLTMRLTDTEAIAYRASLENQYGYRYNGINSLGSEEYIKEERRLTIESSDASDDVYLIYFYKEAGMHVPVDCYFNDLELPYSEEGYIVGADPIRVHGTGISEDGHSENGAYVAYYFEDGTVAHNLRNPGTYKITAEVRYSGNSQYNYFDRRITATITILPQ